ncbi:hypothetical protein [Pedobacter sp. GR22-6]|uniref:hypothetical protein n=1 Tax=Pedobacter sp. GR22-6 TaxID=3127957 RepID=UPI00307CEA31
MSFLTFTAALCGIYLLYYSVMIGIDLMGEAQTLGTASKTLVIEGLERPEKVSLTDVGFNKLVKSDLVSAAAAVGLGGVSLKEVFELSRAKALEYTRPVSF